MWLLTSHSLESKVVVIHREPVPRVNSPLQPFHDACFPLMVRIEELVIQCNQVFWMIGQNIERYVIND